ncbi:hypothetical protein AB0O91_34725 [Kitasatospora sp. NPDC089797]|uniref:hypothetical protein n=1 Tax=Kitasatospora sp. NPDC089797 TaxID=3155298 RepID=UPI0034139D52
MVQAILNLVDRAVSGGRKAQAADAYCQCPAGTTTNCVNETLWVTECCSFNCAVAPSCTTYAIVGGC